MSKMKCGRIGLKFSWLTSLKPRKLQLNFYREEKEETGQISQQVNKYQFPSLRNMDGHFIGYLKSIV